MQIWKLMLVCVLFLVPTLDGQGLVWEERVDSIYLGDDIDTSGGFITAILKSGEGFCVEVFYLDTVGWYLDTTRVRVSPSLNNNGTVYAIFITETKIEWKPRTRKVVVGKAWLHAKQSDYDKRDRWQLKWRTESECVYMH